MIRMDLRRAVKPWLGQGIVMMSCFLVGPLVADEAIYRDSLTLENGKILPCRVILETESEYRVSLRDGKFKDIPASQVRVVDRLNDRMMRFFEARTPSLEVGEQWKLAEQAESVGLPEIAALQAYSVLLEDPNWDLAHRSLGHKKKKGRWQLTCQDGTLLRAVGRDAFPVKKNGVLELRSPHYVVRSRGGLSRTLNAIFDLERLYVQWMKTFRGPLNPPEVLRPLAIEIYADRESMPGLSSKEWKAPYFDVQGDGKVFTFFPFEGAERPKNLFGLAIEQLLYTLHNLKGDPKAPICRPRVTNHRSAVWLEIGLGFWFHRRFLGEPGYASLTEDPDPATVEPTPEEAKLTLYGLDGGFGLRGAGLKNVIGWEFSQFHEVSKRRGYHEACVRLLVEYLMMDGVIVGKKKQARSGRAALLDYVSRVFRDAVSGSSSKLDACLGYRVEDLQDDFVGWVRNFRKPR